MSVRILLVLLAGCGRVGFDLHAKTGDAGTDAAACTSFSPWSAPVALANLDTSSRDYGCQITGDGLTLYFDSNRDGSEDLFVATRPDRASPFGAPQKLLDLDTSADEGDASPSADALELIFYQASDDCLLDARRAMPTDLWNIPTVTTICTSTGAFITHDGLTLYYSTLLDGNGEGQLNVTTRASTDELFTRGAPINELLAGANKGYPATSRDELTIYFESTGGDGPDLDLFQATRASRSDPWGTPSRVDELDTPSNEGDPSITDDGLEMYFESEITGTPDIYVATRTCQ